MVAIHKPGPVNIAGKKYTRADLEKRIAAPPSVPVKSGLPVRIKKMDFADRIKEADRLLRLCGVANLAPLLPCLLNLSGQPYTLEDHFVFEPFFSTQMPRFTVLKTGRQVSKSTSLAAQGIILSTTIPYFNTLFVTPLYELTRRFSGNYVNGFVRQSPIRRLLVDSTCNQNVLQRSFRNESIMYFSFASLNADRTRGLNCAKTVYDEFQDMDPEFPPIIREVMSGSRHWGIEQRAGTPKTLEGPMETSWGESSQGEWHIWCQACGYENIPSIHYDLDQMTGPDVVTRDISEEYPGTVCAKCSRPISPRDGGWVHHYPDLRQEFAGYHVPQFLLPMHYAEKDKWAVLLGKRMGFGNTPQFAYYNEVCGESFDSGAKLVSQSDLVNACTARPNDLEYLKTRRGNYIHVVVAVDWGHGAQPRHGKKKIGFHGSFTAVAVMGLTADGKVDVLYGQRFRQTHDWLGEAKRLLEITAAAQATHIIHDYTGAGNLREHIMTAAGYPAHRLIPISLVRAAVGPLMRHLDENPDTMQRDHYQIDKARSLQMTCQLIRLKQIRFFEYDHKGPGQPGLLHDFLALVEDAISARAAGDTYTIIRDEQVGPDDFAQAVNLGVCALFYMNEKWPDMEIVTRAMITPEMMRALDPPNIDWDEAY